MYKDQHQPEFEKLETEMISLCDGKEKFESLKLKMADLQL